MKKVLTQRQQEILDFVREFSNQNQMPPTLNEIAAHFNIRCSSAAYHLEALRKKGWLERTQGARSIALKEKAVSCAPDNCLRLVPVQQDSDTVYPGSTHIGLSNEQLALCPRERFIAFRIEDDSMFELGIHNGDIVLAVPPEFISCRPGDLVLAELPDGTRVVRSFFNHSSRQFELVPANSDFKSFTFPVSSTVIKGIVVSLSRNF
jgi:repressor LexA